METTCGKCSKVFSLPLGEYNRRIKRTKNEVLYCSDICRATSRIVPGADLKCQNCGKDFHRRYIRKISRQPFCGRPCAASYAHSLQSSKDATTLKQKGITAPQRGRVGHIVSTETRMKIGLTKIDKPFSWDYHDAQVMHRLEDKGIRKYVLIRPIIPDAVYIEDGKLVAYELEREKWFAGCRTKMKLYSTNEHKYDKVILDWFDMEGNFKEEWILENNEWKQV